MAVINNTIVDSNSSDIPPRSRPVFSKSIGMVSTGSTSLRMSQRNTIPSVDVENTSVPTSQPSKHCITTL